jgi:hypothetical protein
VGPEGVSEERCEKIGNFWKARREGRAASNDSEEVVSARYLTGIFTAPG